MEVCEVQDRGAPGLGGVGEQGPADRGLDFTLHVLGKQGDLSRASWSTLRFYRDQLVAVYRNG